MQREIKGTKVMLFLKLEFETIIKTLYYDTFQVHKFALDLIISNIDLI